MPLTFVLDDDVIEFRQHLAQHRFQRRVMQVFQEIFGGGHISLDVCTHTALHAARIFFDFFFLFLRGSFLYTACS